MLCYNYDNTTNEYLSSTECVLDPLETEQQGTDVWMLPANATFIEPPAAQIGFVRVWQKVKWVQVEDHRGTKYWLPGDAWDSEPREMKDLGPLPNDYMLTAPSKPLEEVRTNKLSKLDGLWKTAEETGVLQSSLGFPVDINTRANRDIAGLISQMEMTSIAKTQFCDANNAFHEVTLDNLKVLQLELIQYAQSLYATKWQLRASIEAAKTVDELNAIDIKFVTDFTPTPVVLTPNTSGGADIDEKTSGPAIARALEWVGGTPDALAAGALSGLTKSGYSTSEDATTMLGSGYTAWCHEFTGTGDVTQTMPNITNERDGFLLLIRNSKTTGDITLVPGGQGDTIDSKTSYTVTPGHSVFMVSCDAQSRWVVVFDSGQNISKKPAYIESDSPVVIPDGLHRVVLAFQNGTGTITQTLPDLSKVTKGAHMQVRNIRTDGGTVDLLPFAGQTINGATSAYTIDPDTDVFLLAEGDDWFVWYTASHEEVEPYHLKIKDTNVDTLDVQYPLEVQLDADNNKATLNVNPGAYQPMSAPGIYAVLSEDVSVTGRGTSPIHTGKVFCGEVIYPGDPFLRLNPTTKGLTIQDVSLTDDPNVSGGTPFVVIAHVAFDQIASEDFDITCRLWSHRQGFPEEAILTDVNGRLMSVTRSVKAGEQIEDIVIEGIVMAKEVQDIGISISHTAMSDVLQLGGRVRGGTCLVAQAITQNNHTGVALQCYEQDFKKSVLFEKKYFGELASIKFWLEQRQTPHTTAAGDTFRQANGWCLDSVSPIVFDVADSILRFKSTQNDLADFCMSWDSNTTDTAAMRGKEIDITYNLRNPEGAFNLVVLKWTDPKTRASEKKIASRNNETITWSPGWELVSTHFIAEQPSGSYSGSVITATVPEDAEQIAIGIVPVVAQNPLELEIKELTIQTGTPFYTFEMSGTDVMKARATNTITFARNVHGYAGLRYTINDTFTSAPIGEQISGKAKITVNDTINNIAGSAIQKDGGVFVLGQDARVTVYLKALLANEQTTENIVEFQMFTFDEDGKATPIPNCNLMFKVPGKSSTTVYKGTLPAFIAKGGDQFAVMMKSNKKDGVYLYTTDVTPLLSYKIATA